MSTAQGGDSSPAEPDILSAAAAGDAERVAALLQENPDLVKTQDPEGGTALHRASFGGHAAVAERLLADGADVNARSGWQVTPLHMAGTVEMTGFLLDQGAHTES